MGTKFNRVLKNVIDSILNIIYPSLETCVICGEDLNEDSICICNKCKDNIKYCKDKINIGDKIECYSVAYYSNIMMELIHKLKYKGDFSCGDIIAKLMIDLIKLQNLDFDYIEYVPMTKFDKSKRGYNQAQYLAALISNYFSKDILSCLLKTKSTKDQIGLDNKKRRENMAGAFTLKSDSRIKNSKILLIDDVITTGATAGECAQELINYGANKIVILTAAKSSI